MRVEHFRVLLALAAVQVLVQRADLCTYKDGIIRFSGTFTSKSLTKSSLDDCPKNSTEVELDNNEIETVDHDTFVDFYQLHRVDLSHNRLDELPEELLHFKWELTYFDVSYNNLTELKDGMFRDNPDLRTFLANNNEISTIGLGVFHKDLTKILLVNMSYNVLTAFEPWPYLTNSIQTDDEDLIFDLQYNRISEFRNTLNWTYDLRQPYEYEVFLQYNEISNFSTDMLSLYHPDYTGSAVLEFLTYEMNVSYNPFHCDCIMYPFARDLHISIFRFHRIASYRYICSGPPELAGIDGLHDVELDQFVCHVRDKCPLGCSCIERPHIKQLVVNCSGAGLRSLPDRLPQSDGLLTLIMDYNQITQFTIRNYFSKLLNVSLTYNNLQYIDPSAMARMRSLQVFDVSHNRLAYIPSEIQLLAFDAVRVSNNPLECACNMTWMADWVNLSPSAPDYHVTCTHNGDEKYEIREVTDNSLSCKFEGIAIGISVGLGAVIAIAIGGVITAKRCPYETKVLLFRFLRIHPSDKYKVDGDENRDYDIYISYDTEDVQARQWIKTVFLKKLEEGQNRKYKVFAPQRDAEATSPYADELISNMRKSRRIIFLLTEGFFDNEWNKFEGDQAELEHHSSDNLHGRVIYMLWNKKFRDSCKVLEDPWRARMEGKRVLCPDDRLFWSKMRYELPLKPLTRVSVDRTVNFQGPSMTEIDMQTSVFLS